MDPEKVAPALSPIWLVVGNIIGEHGHGAMGSLTRSGTRLFRPNARCYLAGWHDYMAVLHPDRERSLLVFCQQRQSRKWITCMINSLYVENWRITLEYKPSVLRGIHKVFPFAFEPKFDWKDDRNSPEAIQTLFQAWEAWSNARVLKPGSHPE